MTTSTTSKYHVVMEGGATWDVVADQRDYAAWEIQPFGCPIAESFGRVFTYSRFLAWNAGRRGKLHSLTWEQFADGCVSAESLDQDDADREGREDPGQSAASAES
jgi:hypothetical protein